LPSIAMLLKARRRHGQICAAISIDFWEGTCPVRPSGPATQRDGILLLVRRGNPNVVPPMRSHSRGSIHAEARVRAPRRVASVSDE
jgi:hypothetical protein